MPDNKLQTAVDAMKTAFQGIDGPTVYNFEIEPESVVLDKLTNTEIPEDISFPFISLFTSEITLSEQIDQRTDQREFMVLWLGYVYPDAVENVASDLNKLYEDMVRAITRNRTLDIEATVVNIKSENEIFVSQKTYGVCYFTVTGKYCQDTV